MALRIADSDERAAQLLGGLDVELRDIAAGVVAAFEAGLTGGGPPRW